MTAANALMRLMGEQGKETPMEKYVRMKKTQIFGSKRLNHMV